MVELLVQYSRTHVGQAAYAQRPHAHVACGYRLGHRRHADGISAQDACKTHLGRGLELWAKSMYTPSLSVVPHFLAALRATSCAALSQVVLMSKKRGPSPSGLRPLSGLSPISLMWSVISIRFPGPQDVLTQPAALVRNSLSIPITWKVCTG